MTNLTYGILPSFFWTLIMPIMWLVSEAFFSFYSSALNTIGAELSGVIVTYFLFVLNRSGSSPTHSRSHRTTEQRHWYVVSLLYENTHGATLNAL